MDKTPPSVAQSGASFTAASRSSSRSSLLPKPITTSRTIVETQHCPPELRKGSKGWSIHDLKVQRILGEGALSTVVHCLSGDCPIPMALKMYHRDKLNSLNVKQVGREIDIHASLSHPNIIKLYAAFEDADGIYLVQEFATGGDLYAELARHGGYMLEAHVSKNVMTPFLTAMCHLHSRGILHRDIKPENILLTAQGEIKIADFGLAIDTGREKPMSRVGTLDYMPPEIAILPRAGAPIAPLPGSPSAPRPPTASPHGTPKSASPLGVGPAGAAAGKNSMPGTPTGSLPVPPPTPPTGGNYGLPADVWCCGILAYELLVGGPPFEADTKEATYTRILKTQPFIPGHLSREAQEFIRLALQKDPEMRCTIEQLAAHPWLKGAVQRPKTVAGSAGQATAAAAPAAAVAASAGLITSGGLEAGVMNHNGDALPQNSVICEAYAAKTPIPPATGSDGKLPLPAASSANAHIPTSAESVTPSGDRNAYNVLVNATTNAKESVKRALTPNPSNTGTAAGGANSMPSITEVKKKSVSNSPVGEQAQVSLSNRPLSSQQKQQSQAIAPAENTKSMEHTNAPTHAPPQQVMHASRLSVSSTAAPTSKSPSSTTAATSPKIASKSALRNASDSPQSTELIAASYGEGVTVSNSASAMQSLARPPAPASGSKRRPRILSAYLKKLNLSGFMGLGGSISSSKSKAVAQKDVEMKDNKAEEPPVRLSKLSRGGGN